MLFSDQIQAVKLDKEYGIRNFTVQFTKILCVWNSVFCMKHLLYMLHMVSLINSCIKTNQTWVSFDGMLMHLNMKIWFSHILFTSMSQGHPNWNVVSPSLSDLDLLIYCCFVFLLTCPLGNTTLYWMDRTCMHTLHALFPCSLCTCTQAFTHAQISHPISTASLGLYTHAHICTHTYTLILFPWPLCTCTHAPSFPS